MRNSRINKIINWKGKEYAHIIESEPAPFCDFCVFRNECQKVLTKQLSFEDSPLRICSDLCDAENTSYAFFMEAGKAENYIKTH